MKKLFVFVLLLGLMISSLVNASTRLKCKEIEKPELKIDFVDGTGEKVKIFDSKLKVEAVVPKVQTDLLLDVKVHKNPDVNVYYYREDFFIAAFDSVFGVPGIVLKLDNLTENDMTVRWSESEIKIGEICSMPRINRRGITVDGKPVIPSDTTIPPKSSVEVTIYSSSKIHYFQGQWVNGLVPISDDGSTRVTVTMKIDMGGEVKDYVFESPCVDLPADFVSERLIKKYQKDKKKG